jgi:hypothetical protein
VSGSSGPYDHIPTATLDEESRHALLGEALAGVDLGAYDEQVLSWLGRQPTPVVRSVAGMVERARADERARKHPRPWPSRRPVPGRAYVLLTENVVDLLREGR